MTAKTVTNLFPRSLPVPLCLALLVFICPARAQQQRLFIISKNTNNNVVCFDALIDSNGFLNKKQPVICYWRSAGQDSEKTLNYLERKAYQYKLSTDTGGNCRLVFNRLPHQDIMLTNDSGCYRALVRAGSVTLWLEEVHLVFTNSSLFQPVQRIEFYGKDSSTSQNLDPGITARINTGCEASK